MNTLRSYVDLIVDPTFADFEMKRGSARHAFLTCVAIYHAVDRAGPKPGRPGNLVEEWRRESLEFKLVDVIAHHFKHVRSDAERIPPSVPGLPIGFALGFNEAGDEMDLRNIYYVIRDAVRFVQRKAAEET